MSLSSDQVARCREVMNRASWIDGRVTAGYQSAVVKDNRQLSETSPEARELGDMIVAALERSPLFITAALPLRVFPPLFNRYEGGETFGAHLDNSIRQIPGTPYRIRTDISATLFLSSARRLRRRRAGDRRRLRRALRSNFRPATWWSTRRVACTT